MPRGVESRLMRKASNSTAPASSRKGRAVRTSITRSSLWATARRMERITGLSRTRGRTRGAMRCVHTQMNTCILMTMKVVHRLLSLSPSLCDEDAEVICNHCVVFV